MTWQGTIKFINSFPSPRRAGLWVLVSVLSIEQAGRIYLKVRHAAACGGGVTEGSRLACVAWFRTASTPSIA
jgi:hypothetical protein